MGTGQNKQKPNKRPAEKVQSCDQNNSTKHSMDWTKSSWLEQEKDDKWNEATVLVLADTEEKTFFLTLIQNKQMEQQFL